MWQFYLLLLLLQAGEGVLHWGEVAKFLGNGHTLQQFSAESQMWRHNFSSSLSSLNSYVQDEVIFYPFSGADVSMPLAIMTSRQLKHIVLASQEESVVIPYKCEGKPSHEGVSDLLMCYQNMSFLRDVRGAVHNVLRKSENGYLLGHTQRKFARQFGILPLILASLGTMKKFRVKDVKQVSESLSDLEISICERKSKIKLKRQRCINIEYFYQNLHDPESISRCDSKLRQFQNSITTIIKAVDEGGLLTHAVPHSKFERDRQKSAKIFASWLVNVSSTIIQDVTGVHVHDLVDRFNQIDLFGAYLKPCEEIELEVKLNNFISKEKALGDLYLLARDSLPTMLNRTSITWHRGTEPLLYYGHCIVPWSCHSKMIKKIEDVRKKCDSAKRYTLPYVQASSSKLGKVLCHYIIATSKTGL